MQMYQMPARLQVFINLLIQLEAEGKYINTKGEFAPTNKQLGEILGVHLLTVQKYFIALEEFGLYIRKTIKRTIRSLDITTLKKNFSDAKDKIIRSLKEQVKDLQQKIADMLPKNVEAKGKEEEKRKQEESLKAETQNTPDTPDTKNSISARLKNAAANNAKPNTEEGQKSLVKRFDEFWEAYKKEGNELRSRKFWRQAIQEGKITSDNIEDVIQKARQYIESREGKYIKGADSWIVAQDWRNTPDGQFEDDTFTHISSIAKMCWNMANGNR